jgi:hypothetical protein
MYINLPLPQTYCNLGKGWKELQLACLTSQRIRIRVRVKWTVGMYCKCEFCLPVGEHIAEAELSEVVLVKDL